MRSIAYDCTLKRPGCVLVQAALGAYPGDKFQTLFPPEVWLTSPTPDMKVYPIESDEQLKHVANITAEAHL